ncbi:S41 family peptidase [Streptomyces calidiresistens]|uniref:PDZ domain-containing protein n=1 Tax=Streptomyces calidiresistens TaxID=1485586 RepID=A0A7W3T353_9ACTN|nr:S41 family peptidase [Streptomyces calidiresistens]MBB0230043.1 PDZ domain-containing protein [Streptomyces calidiresistens]
MSRLRNGDPTRPARRGTALAGLLVGALAAGAAGAAWGDVVADLPPAGIGPGSTAPVDAEIVVGRSGDAWSASYTAEEYEAWRLSLEGEYVGTGISVRKVAEDRIEIERVHEGGPADRAGLRPGDTLRSVDGVAVEELPVTEVVARLRGSDLPPAEAGPGSRVRLGVERAAPPVAAAPGAGAGAEVPDRVSRSAEATRTVPADGGAGAAPETIEVEVERAVLVTDPVTVHRDAPGTTRVRISSFVQGSADRLRAEVARVPEEEGIVLDLRGNSGGLITEAAEAASVFLDGGLVGTYDVRGVQHALRADPGGDTTRPVVVLVDGGTMSSAELLTGALRDRNRAVVVGRPTFGKGTVQMPSHQPDGSVAELTVGTYATPAGTTPVEGEGLEPDVPVERGEDPVVRAGRVLAALSGGA